MNGIDAYIYIIISLFGVAYPILLQVIARLDEKYFSDKIVELFENEWENKAFRYSLILSLVFIVIWSLELKPIVQINGLDFFIANSATILLAINAIILVFLFFRLVRKILLYYSPTKFIPYLIERQSKSDNDFQFFAVLSELLLLFIRQKQTTYTKTLSDFFNLAFKKIRDKQVQQPVVYPEVYYKLVYKAIEELAIVKEKRNYILEYYTAGEIWLLGELQGNEISEETYYWMWNNLIISNSYKQDDLILNHWETCHQFYNSELREISPEFGVVNENYQLVNQEKVNKREKERKRFIEFHYALGGLLMYTKRYNCINRIFNHTQSQPATYVLLPISMNQIFKFSFEIRDIYERNYNEITERYSFPKLSGLNAYNVIRKWILSYMAVLFLRQYKISPFIPSAKPLDFPSFPKTQGQINQWIEGLNFFKKLVTEHLSNKELLESLELSFITEEWCKKHKLLAPIKFVDRFKLDLEELYDRNSSSLEVSVDIGSTYKKLVKNIIEPTIRKLKLICNTDSIPEGESDSWFLKGRKMLHGKEAFIENPEADYSAVYKFLPNQISSDILEGFSKTFKYKTTEYYLIKTHDFFKAIDSLIIDESYVIINFGINLNFFINQIRVPELTKDNYKNIKIFSFEGWHPLRDSLFILKKSDLPQILNKPIDLATRNKYELDEIEKNNLLYCSIIDLNKATEEFIEEIKKEKSVEEIKKMVLINIDLSLEIRWNKNIEVIQLNQDIDFLEKGIANNLTDIKPLN